ncbi:MAG: hypothetical protein MUF06_19350 [Pirellulaceae bacterium]|nr:hypothetical protein [Pirellulaceae bacterium]
MSELGATLALQDAQVIGIKDVHRGLVLFGFFGITQLFSQADDLIEVWIVLEGTSDLGDPVRLVATSPRLENSDVTFKFRQSRLYHFRHIHAPFFILHP